MSQPLTPEQMLAQSQILFGESENVPEEATEEDPFLMMIYTVPVPERATTEKSSAG